MSQQINQPRAESQEIEIDLLDLFGYFMSRLPVLIAAILIGALAAGLFTTFFVQDRFTAKSKMYMLSSSSDSILDLSDLNLGSNLSEDYAQLMKSRPVLDRVRDKLGLEYSYSELSGMVSLNVINNTRIMEISVTSHDPEEAMNIANQLALAAKMQIPKIMSGPSPTIVEQAVLPTSRSGPNLKRNTMMGALVCLVLVLAVLTIRYLMDDSVKTAEDVEKAFGVMPLSVIPEGDITGLKKDDEEGRRKRKRRSRRQAAKKSGTKGGAGRKQKKGELL